MTIGTTSSSSRALFKADISPPNSTRTLQDQNLKKVVATVKFSHPVVADEFEKHLVLELRSKKDGKEQTQPYRFQVSYDKLRAHAFVHSDPLQIPEREAQMWVRVGAGLRAARGGRASERAHGAGHRARPLRLPAHQRVAPDPGQQRAVRARAGAARRDNTGISEGEMKKSINATLLPLRH